MPRVWDLISNGALADLMRWQYEHYPKVKLSPPDEPKQLVTFTGELEDIEEIDKLIRQPPSTSHGKAE